MIELEVTGLPEMDAALKRFARDLDDFGSLWDRIGLTMSEFETRWFETEGDGTWAPLAASTERFKVTHGFPPEILQREEALFESVIDPAQAGDFSQGRSSLGTFTDKVFVWGTDVRDKRGKEYAHFHQDGTDEMPQRQVIPWPLPASLEAELHADQEEWLREIVAKSGLE